MSFNLTISGRIVDQLPEGMADREHPGYQAIEEDVIVRAAALVEALKAHGHEVTFAHAGTEHLNVDLVSGARTQIIPETPAVEPVPVPRLVDAQGPVPADPSAPVSEQQDGTVTP